MRISDWSSDVCSSDLITRAAPQFSPLKPDLLRNYELGVKGGTADGQLLFDAAIYYIDWRDEIGRALRRERVWQYVWLSVVAATSNKTRQHFIRQGCVTYQSVSVT